MKILITSGGTSERIDQVRSITNHSTGRLGAVLAEKFLAKGDQVTLVTTRRALKPAAHEHLRLEIVENVDDLLAALEPLVKSHDALIHSMAVSDYTPVYMTGLEEAAASSDLTAFLRMTNSESKISSQEEAQVLFLRKTPKIISKVKEWNPQICLIGFKLLVGVSREKLIETARASLDKNQADIIVANDLLGISENQHQAFLVRKDSLKEAHSKEEIAQQLVHYLHTKEL